MLEYYRDKTPKGEYVLVVEGAEEEPVEKTGLSLDEVCEIAKKLADGGMKLSEACKEAAKQTKYTKSEIYNNLVNQ